MPILSKLFYRFKAISIKIAAEFFADRVKLILKFIWDAKRTKISKTFLKEQIKEILRLMYSDIDQIRSVISWRWEQAYRGKGLQRDTGKVLG